MTFKINPLHRADSYKLGHRLMYPDLFEFGQSNFTARGSRIPGITSVVFIGLQAFVQDLQESWQENFFDRDVDEVVAHHRHTVGNLLGSYDLGEDHIRDLHQLGYLPLRFSALDEGTLVPLRVPMFIVENTHRSFGWLVNYIESDLSCSTWLPITSATTAYKFRELLDHWAEETSDTPEFVDWQGHDFSLRGMENILAGAASGAGHLLSFAGTDSMPSLDWISYFYDAPGFIGGSVPASEHSVMCAGGELTELETFRRLIRKFPTGIISIVADTWDLWLVLTQHMITLKDEIMARDGKVVIRPDSGDPVDILCGTERFQGGSTEPAKGVIELLWDVFGGTVNSKGFKVLDSHIGAIYGDSINMERADQICSRLYQKGFASTNVVLGIGSFTYQYVTRDTHMHAMKQTWAQVDGVGHNLFKDPVTDSGVKKSAKGRLAVLDVDGVPTLVNEATPEQEAQSLLKPIWENGNWLKRHTYAEICARVGKRQLMPA